MNSKDKGNICEAMVLAALIREGHHVLVPFGDNLRYDLAVDVNGNLIRIQCKTARPVEGGIQFKTCSSQVHRGKGCLNYNNQAEYFGIYSPTTSECHLVPVKLCGGYQCTLRITTPKNRQKKFVRYAAQYKLGNIHLNLTNSMELLK